MALSDVRVRNAKARSKPYKITDGEGMFLLVAASGSKKSMGSKHIGFHEKKAGGTIPRLLRKEKHDNETRGKRLLDYFIRFPSSENS